MNKRITVRIFTAVYCILLGAAVLSSLFQFTEDCILFATGAIKTQEFTADDFSLKNLDKNGDILVSTSPDSQLIIEEYNKRSTMLEIEFSFSRYPGEVNLYYTFVNEEFSDSQKVWGKMRGDGKYSFVMPRGVLKRIRLDPTSLSNNELRIISCTLNPRRAFMSYFNYNGEWLFSYIIGGAILACAVAYIYTEYTKQISALYSAILRRLKAFTSKKKAE